MQNASPEHKILKLEYLLFYSTVCTKLEFLKWLSTYKDFVTYR